MTDTATTSPITIVPANEASWDDLQAVFGTRGDQSRCQCRRYKIPARRWDREWSWSPMARQRGARALESYPMITQPGQEVTWGELHVGSRSIFEAAGFTEVNYPTLRRVVMRIDF